LNVLGAIRVWVKSIGSPASLSIPRLWRLGFTIADLLSIV
jgi:hypothetical protein